ncbi:unnamed protein product [Clonostachys rhizophaga]|uniref:Uncharacterized protein n=1 Tax=Clonostachys rhizophaga TaxID=160324 RepID=A0A9N9YFX8_9HYPO|nr:unnamed protein product [Clonostachys rhizophaga]
MGWLSAAVKIKQSPMLDQTEAKYQTLGAPDPWAVLPGFVGRRYGKEAAANQKAAGGRSGKRYDEYGWERWSHRTASRYALAFVSDCNNAIGCRLDRAQS